MSNLQSRNVTNASRAEVETASRTAQRNGKFQPYTGKDALPNYTTVRGRVVPGEARYALVRGNGKKFKLLAYKRTPAGVERTVAHVLSPNDPKNTQDRALYETLKKAGIPGAF